MGAGVLSGMRVISGGLFLLSPALPRNNIGNSEGTGTGGERSDTQPSEAGLQP